MFKIVCGGFPVKDLQIELLYDPAIPLLDIYPKDRRALIWKVLAQLFSLQHYSQLLRVGANPSVHKQMDRLKIVVHIAHGLLF
ncbi:hypothetical protein NEIELOOT_01793, partial [Neisseria elongata subsp. glycolytica ATCC 29315]